MDATLATPHASPDAEIGERIHQLLWRRRMPQAELATRIGVAQSTMSKKLRGERPWYSGELIVTASVLNVSVGYLFGEAEEPASPSGGPSAAPLNESKQTTLARVTRISDRRDVA